MAYILKSQALRVVQKDDRGRVTYRRSYRRGASVDVSRMDPDRLDLFLAKGYIVDTDAEENIEEEQEPQSPAQPSAPHPTPTENPGKPEEEDEETVHEAPQEEQPQVAPSEDDEDDVEQVDEYSDMDYPTLQHTAKGRGLNAGGSAEDIRGRLREADAASNA